MELSQVVIEEKRELDEKRGMLSDFMNSETFHQLPTREQALLLLQVSIMANYSDVLAVRLHLFHNKEVNAMNV